MDLDARTDPPSSFFYVLQEAVRILFVDDDPIMREFATVHLSTDQAEVTVAGDGLEALQALERDPFDIVLIDLEMPRMDGFEALGVMRKDQRTKALPIVVVTGREDIAAIDRAFQAGATSFLAKPINWRLLSYQIRYICRAHQTELSLHRAMVREHSQNQDALCALRRLAQDGADLIRIAMQGDAELRRAAVRFATLLAETAEPAEKVK